MPSPADIPTSIAMSAEELEGIGIQRYGGFGWISAMARELGIGRRTAQRWAIEGIPKPATARAVRALAASPIDPAFTPQLGGDRRSSQARGKGKAAENDADEAGTPQAKLDL